MRLFRKYVDYHSIFQKIDKRRRLEKKRGGGGGKFFKINKQRGDDYSVLEGRLIHKDLNHGESRHDVIYETINKPKT